jgi:hypothetical protein
MRWASAAGNESSITAAKETITGALIGLIIALGSYTILNFINPQIIATNQLAIQKIPPPDISKCGDPCEDDVDCLPCNYGRSFCVIPAHICAAIGMGQLNDTCKAGDNTTCEGNLKCKGDNNGVGTCSDGSEDSFCDESEKGTQGSCDAGLVCTKMEGGLNLYKCLSTETGKAAGDTCTDKKECTSGICFRNICSDGTDLDNCDINSDCADGYSCIEMPNTTHACSAGVSNSPCGSNSDCQNNYYCYTSSTNPEGTALNVCIAKSAEGESCGYEGYDEDDYNQCLNSLDCVSDDDSGNCPCTCE